MLLLSHALLSILGSFWTFFSLRKCPLSSLPCAVALRAKHVFICSQLPSDKYFLFVATTPFAQTYHCPSLTSCGSYCLWCASSLQHSSLCSQSPRMSCETWGIPTAFTRAAASVKFAAKGSKKGASLCTDLSTEGCYILSYVSAFRSGELTDVHKMQRNPSFFN